MTTVFSSLTASITALTELVSLVSDVALLCLGVTAAAKLLEAIERIIRAWLWVAGLVQLLFQLLCAAVAEYGPVIGRHLGCWAGRTVAAGRAVRRWYDAHLAPTASVLVAHADYAGRQFVIAQCGDALPTVRAAIAPSLLLSLRIDRHQPVTALEVAAPMPMAA